MKAIFSQVTIYDAKRMASEVSNKWKKRSSKFSDWLEDACAESFTFYKFEEKYWRKIRTSNPLE